MDLNYSRKMSSNIVNVSLRSTNWKFDNTILLKVCFHTTLSRPCPPYVTLLVIVPPFRRVIFSMDTYAGFTAPNNQSMQYQITSMNLIPIYTHLISTLESYSSFTLTFLTPLNLGPPILLKVYMQQPKD